MKKIKWRWEDDLYMDFCPYCDEPAYEKDKCVFCGKPYKWVEPKYKETIVQEGEYTIVQATNKHVHIYQNGEFVFHAQCTKRYTEQELRDYLRRYKIEMPKLFAMEEQLEREGDEGDFE